MNDAGRLPSAATPWVFGAAGTKPRGDRWGFCRDRIDPLAIIQNSARIPVALRRQHPADSHQSALRCWMDHWPATLATNEVLPFNKVVPFISQIATLPDVSCQMMSDLPSPL